MDERRSHSNNSIGHDADFQREKAKITLFVKSFVDLMITTMDEQELREYLEMPLTARLATCEEGWPHVVPVWFEYDKGCIWVPSQTKTRKVHAIRRNKRVGMVIDTFSEDHSKFNRVIVRGEAELVTDASVRDRTVSIFKRYMGQDCEKTEHFKQLLAIKRLIIKVKPIRITAIKEAW